MNTMRDLRELLVERMKETIDGREFDMEERQIRVPHMIGVTPTDTIHNRGTEDGTLLDVQHEFWQNYEKDIRTKSQLQERIRNALHTLSEDGTLNIIYPKGREAGIVYVEVDDLD